MKKFQYLLCVLLALSGLGHVVGTFTAYRVGTDVFVWSLAATAFTWTIVFLHVLRIQRPADRLIRIGAVICSVAWIVLSLMFGLAEGNIFDPRAMMHAIVTLLLVGASFVRPSPATQSAPAGA